MSTSIPSTERAGRASQCAAVDPLSQALRALIIRAALGVSVATLAFASASPAFAQAPWWRLESRTAPGNLPPRGEAQIVVAATNVGDAQASASEADPITISDVLPAGLTATKISGESDYPEQLPMSCSLEKLSCSYTNAEGVLPYHRLEVKITVKVSQTAKSGEQNTVNMQDRSAPVPRPVTRAIKVSSESTPFGVEDYALTPEEEGGSPDAQAGSHPFQLTATFNLDQTLEPRFGELFPNAPTLPRDLSFRLPPGLLGNPTATPRCSDVDFSTIAQDGSTNLCPANTAVGVAVVTIHEPENLPFTTIAVPLFNLEPARGEPARFGFEAVKVPVVLDTAVKSGEGYGVVVSVSEATQAAAILGSQVTFWGTPGAQSHDDARGWACLDLPPEPERKALKNCQTPPEHRSAAFLTLPTSCSGQPLRSVV